MIKTEATLLDQAITLIEEWLKSNDGKSIQNALTALLKTWAKDEEFSDQIHAAANYLEKKKN